MVKMVSINIILSNPLISNLTYVDLGFHACFEHMVKMLLINIILSYPLIRSLDFMDLFFVNMGWHVVYYDLLQLKIQIISLIFTIIKGLTKLNGHFVIRTKM